MRGTTTLSKFKGLVILLHAILSLCLAGITSLVYYCLLIKSKECDTTMYMIAISLSEGVVEIWLTSEDTGAYGRDIGSSLPELLWQLIDVIPAGAMLRLGMTNPPYILEHLEV